MPSVNEKSNEEQKPCRTCMDFKTWAKQQRSRQAKQQPTPEDRPKKPASELGRFQYGCPLDKDELGRSTWALLHTMAATYPERPNAQQSEDVTKFMHILSRAYPCDICAKDLATELKQEPVVATSGHEFGQWMCRLHNKINLKLGKPEFDCSKVNERWRDGWLDGSCD